ncbi:hypothetical protein [Planctomycetes bacterium K23_9]|uniref:Nickel uptake substrate-specific transmembrane region n=1 Tax=Stieleria marina TaxID=1930275 RepID=A0A517NUY6_9BACT|nr:Nickel uptake substrate-specific transmembrane region [Planctomycetes bacterium K23_9]
MIHRLRQFLALIFLIAGVHLPAVAQQMPARTFEGTVVDQQGQPIAGAMLWYRYASERPLFKPLEMETRADAQGRFVLEVPSVTESENLVASSRSILWAWAPGYALGFSERHWLDQETKRIELAPATDTSFVVVDVNGEPVTDVLVEPQNYRNWLGYDLVPNLAVTQLRRRTDKDGRVKFPSLLKEKLFRLRLTSVDFGIQTIRPGMQPSEPAERTITLRQVSRIEGRVVADHLAWCGGIKLHFSTEKPFAAGKTKRPPWPTEGKATAVTDKTGRFVVPVIAEGRVRIEHSILSNDVHARPLFPDARLVEGLATKLEIPMQRLVPIRGAIIAKETRMPMKGIKIHVYYGSYRQGTDVVSDANGEFAAWVLPGKVRFQPMNLSATKYSQLGAPKQNEVPEDVPEDEAFELPAIEVVPTEPLQGLLVDQDDKPVAEARVIAYYNNYLCSSATSDADGKFLLGKFPTQIDFKHATYRVVLDEHETRHMRDGDVQIEPTQTLKIQVRR